MSHTVQPNPTVGALLDISSLQEIIAGGETIDVEFKSDMETKHNTNRKQENNTIVETIACLANRPTANPGWLLIGVEDDGTITGAQRQRFGTKERAIEPLVNGRIKPMVQVSVQHLEIDEKLVVAIRVSPSPSPVCTSQGRYLHRTIAGDGKPACEPLDFAGILSFRAATGQLDFTASVMDDVTWQDLDENEITRYRNRIRQNPRHADTSLLELSNNELLKAIGAIEVDAHRTQVRALGVLLFGYEEMIRQLIPTHSVAFQVQLGGEIRWNEIMTWPLIRVMDEVDSMITRTHNEDEVMMGVQRIGLPEFHSVGVREAVANALMHRDYFESGLVQVRWLDSHFDVASPGEFPKGVSWNNYLITNSVARNPLLVSAFKRAGIVDHIARGIRKMFERQVTSGRPPPNYMTNAVARVQLQMTRGKVDLRIVRLVKHESDQSRNLSLDALMLVRHLFDRREIDLQQVMSVTQLSVERANAIILDLTDRGILAPTKQLDNRSWRLVPRVRKLISKPLPGESREPQPIATHQPPADNAALIVTHVAASGRITRQDVVTICQINAKSATRLLSRLTKTGILIKRGQHRNTWYEFPNGGAHTS